MNLARLCLKAASCLKRSNISKPLKNSIPQPITFITSYSPLIAAPDAQTMPTANLRFTNRSRPATAILAQHMKQLGLRRSCREQKCSYKPLGMYHLQVWYGPEGRPTHGKKIRHLRSVQLRCADRTGTLFCPVISEGQAPAPGILLQARSCCNASSSRPVRGHAQRTSAQKACETKQDCVCPRPVVPAQEQTSAPRA